MFFQFLNIEIPKNHDPTIEEKFKITKIINYEKLNLEILDTAGEKNYQNMFNSWVNKGDGFILVFAINDKESFDYLKNIKNKINEIKGENIPIILIGNKIDLKDEREIDEKDVKELIKKWNVEFIECSAKENINCDVILSLIVLKWKNYEKNKNNNNNDKKKDKSNCDCFIY